MRKSRRKYTADQLVVAVESSRTMADVLRKIGLYPGGGNYESVRFHMTQLGIDSAHLRPWSAQTVSRLSDSEIESAVRASKSLIEVIRRLELRPGGNQGRLRKRIRDLGLDMSHFIGQGWRRGSSVAVVPRRALAELLVAGRQTSTNGLKKRLIEEGLKEHLCERCGLRGWLGKPIPIELDHINGNRLDNRLQNLRILCPNCHAQTDTYRGRNIGTGLAYPA